MYNKRADRPMGRIFCHGEKQVKLTRFLTTPTGGVTRASAPTSEEQIVLRLDRAKWEMEQAEKYDYTVVNDDVMTCVNTILNIIAEKAD